MTQNNKALIENSKSSKHTPTPWTTGYRDNQCIYADSKHIATLQCNTKQWEANAAFIVKACNSHEELIKLVKQLTGYLLRNGFSNAIGDEQELIRLAQETIRRTEEI